MARKLDIRPFHDDDAPGRVALVRLIERGDVTTPAGLRHSLATVPERARSRLWSAVEGDEVVGTAGARLAWDTDRDDLGQFWVGVHPERRRHGIGSRLYELADEHLRSVGATKLETWVVDNADGIGFLERRGFRRARTAKLWSVDPREVDTSGLAQLERVRADEGFRVAPLRAVRDRERDLHALYAEAAHDQPADEPEARIELDVWRRRVLAHPDLSLEGSFVALHGERPVSFAWLAVDAEGARATHWFTGTARDYRRRGLARLVKLAAIRWAAGNGVAVIFTGNDSTNADMLALNEHLGYRPDTTGSTYTKDQ